MAPSESSEAMERMVVKVIKEQGKSGAMKMNDLSDRVDISRKDLLDTTNALARKGIIALFTDQNGNSYWHLQSAVEAKKMKDLTPEERLIYGLIRDSKDRGIFKGLIRAKSQMSDTVITKVITKLEGKGLIKQVKDLKKPTQRTYMLKEIEPNISLTGGVWFADGAMDQPLVKVVVQCLERFIRSKSLPRKPTIGDIDPKHFVPNPIFPPSHTSKLPTPASCLAYIISKGVAPSLKFTVTDILAVMRVLIYDGKVEVLKPNYNMAHAEGWNSDLEVGGGGMDKDEEIRFRKEKREQEKSRAKTDEAEIERGMKEIKARSKTKKRSRKDITDSDSDSDSESDSDEDSSEDERSRKKRRSKGKDKQEESKSDKKKRKAKEKKKKEKERAREKEKERERKRRKKKSKAKAKEESDTGGFSDGSDELVAIGSSSKKRKRKDDKSSKKKKKSRRDSSSDTDSSDEDSSTDDSESSSDPSSDESDKIDSAGFTVGNGGFSGPKDKATGGEISVGFNPFDGFNEEEYNLLDDPDVMYRWAKQGSSRMGLSEAPCLRCPTFDFCSEKGPVNPAGCHYFSDWLEPTDIETLPAGLQTMTSVNGHV